MTGWDEHGFAVKTGSMLDHYLGHGDLQDAENCSYAPTSVLAELGVDTAHGDPQVQYRDGRIVLLGGAVLERGGTLNCVWAVTKLPDLPDWGNEAAPARRQHDPGALIEEPDLYRPHAALNERGHLRGCGCEDCERDEPNEEADRG